jgi:DNA-binding GntR family transcriptional regulator
MLDSTTEDSGLHRTKRELAITKVMDAIMLGRYVPGQSLKQSQLMADLDLGATPAREAALELVARGLLIHESHRGMRVAELEGGRVRHVYQVRALLEAEAARLATMHATPDTVARVTAHAKAMDAAFAADDLDSLGAADGRFHAALYDGSGNALLVSLIEQMWQQFPRYALWKSRERVRQSLAEHRAILAHYVAGDAAATAEAVRSHVLHGLAAYEALLQSTGD